MSPARLRTVCAALFACEVAWAAAGLAFPALPGWRMFARVERVDADLVDKTGAAFDAASFVPRDLYITDAATARAVAVFVCRTRPARGPWVLVWRADGRREDACPR